MRRSLQLLLALSIVTAPSLAFAGDPPEPSHEERRVQLISRQDPAPVRSFWKRLGDTLNTCEDSFDYFPKGGLRIFACHARSLMSFEHLQSLTGVKIFLSGPHRKGSLELNAERDFGRYNPAFVRWASEQLLPAAKDPAFRKATQPLYDELVSPLARAFYVTWRKTRAEPACFQREVKRYEAFLAGRDGGEMPYERYFFFMNDRYCQKPEGGFEYFSDNGFDGGQNGNVVKTCTAWWIRRELDGTSELWAAALQRLLKTYEPGLLESSSGGRAPCSKGLEK